MAQKKANKNLFSKFSELYSVLKRHKKWLLLFVIVLALVLRMSYWLEVREEPFVAHLIMDSEEYDQWAMKIAGGEWFGSEVFFQAPLYPYLLGLIYWIFGRHLDIVYLFQIIIAAGGCYALYRAGKKLAGEKSGLIAAFLGATYNVFIFYDVQILKESLAVSVASFLLWVLIEARVKDKYRLWMLAGVLSGMLILLRENMMLVFPFLLILAIKLREKKSVVLKKWVVMILGVVIILFPVALRNYLVGGIFLPTTFQGGVNFYIGNNPEANGTYKPIVPGKQIPYYERREPIRIAEMETGRELTPAEVSNYWFEKSLSWIKKYPLDFIKLELKKLKMFWSWYEWPDAVDYYYMKTKSLVLRFSLFEFGSVFLLALAGLWIVRKRISDYSPVLIFIFAWMASTVIFFLFSRYRLPMVPGLIILAAVPVSELSEALEKSHIKKVLIWGACCLIAFLFPKFMNYEPKMDLVHYNLALVHEQLGHIGKASKHYKKAYSINKNDFLSCNNLGNIYIEKEEWKKALYWYKKAAEIEPESEGVYLNIGMTFIYLRRFEDAEKYLIKALKINPRNVLALHNMAVLMAVRGEINEALQFNEETLKFSPEFAPGLQFKKKLERIYKGNEK